MNSQSQGLRDALARIHNAVESDFEIPDLRGPGTSTFEAWLLGPKGENADELERLIVEAIRDLAFWRRHFHPEDPVHVTDEIKNSPEYRKAIAFLWENYRSLLDFLKRSVPAFSMRYQGHMAWDLAIPGIIGYFATMLHNPNNIAFEGSPATTILEMLVGDDLCQMLGYTIPSQAEIENGAIRPWGHITCGGTVSNIEALWSARNLKFYPLALQAALKDEKAPLRDAKDMMAPLSTGESALLTELDTWSLLNLKADDILALPERLNVEYQISAAEVTEAVSNYSPQHLGMQEFSGEFLSELKESPVLLTPGTKHYSFNKAAGLLGIGVRNMINVAVDRDARMSIPSLREILDDCLQKQRPIYTTVVVMGNTEEGAVDPIQEVLALREEFRERGLEFTIHADAAWGGYHASLIRDDGELGQFIEDGSAQGIGTHGGAHPFERGDDSGDMTAYTVPEAPSTPSISLSKYVIEQFEALGEADSITVDPHKQAYIPYPAGALCYRNSAMRSLVTFDAPYRYEGGAEPIVGIYGIEGSKPGAAAAAVFLTHRVIRPTKSGYGKLIGKALFNCDKLYTRLLCMARPDDNFIVVPLPRLPAEGSEESLKQKIKEKIVDADNQTIGSDPEAMQLLAEIGPDLNILAYAFNIRTPSGEVNTDLELTNRFNGTIYDRIRIHPGEKTRHYNLIVSQTELRTATYGDDFINDYKRRLGVTSEGSSIMVLRSVVMDPWLTDTPKGSFLPAVEDELRNAAKEALEELGFSSKSGRTS